MTPLHVFTVKGSEASSIRVGGDLKEYLSEYPDFSHDFTVYGFDFDSLPVFPPYVKPLILLQKNSFPYTTDLVDVVYSIFPSPENSQKIGVYRRPVRNTVAVYFYATKHGVKASLTELNLQPAMELHRVFMSAKNYGNFAAISETCVPVDGKFKGSTNFDKCVETTNVRTATDPGGSPMVSNSEPAKTKTKSDSTTKKCWTTAAIVASCMLLILVGLMVWKLVSL